MKPESPQSLPPCYCLRTRKANSAVAKFYDHILEPSGVTVRQYSLLLYISQREGISVRELADMAELERSTLARTLKPLFHKGLIVDAKNPGARDSKLQLTENGQETLFQAAALWRQAQETVMEKLGAEKLAMVDEVLEMLQGL